MYTLIGCYSRILPLLFDPAQGFFDSKVIQIMMMNRLPAMFFLFLITTFMAFAAESDEGHQGADQDSVIEESEDGKATKKSYSRDNFHFTVNAGAGFSAYQWHFTGGLQADFYANPVLGVGFKTTVDYGFKYQNLNINLYVLYKIWWFYIGPGVSFIVQGMTMPADDPDYVNAYPYGSVASLAFTGGMRFPLARIGPGFMTIDFSIDWYQNDIPYTEPTPPFTGNTLNDLLYGSVYAFKFGARLGYTF